MGPRRILKCSLPFGGVCSKYVGVYASGVDCTARPFVLRCLAAHLSPPGDAPNAACAWHGYIWRLCVYGWERCCGGTQICLLAPSTFADVHICNRKGPRGAQGRFQDYEVFANCIMLWIVRWLWEGRPFIQFLWPRCLLSLGAILAGGKNQDIAGMLPANVAHSVRGASTAPLHGVQSGTEWQVLRLSSAAEEATSGSAIQAEG